MRIVAYFDSPEALARGARTARDAGWRTVSAASPAFDETVLDVARASRSPVAGVSVAGGIIGLVSGVLLTVGTVRQWPGVIVSGKPLVSVPPFLIIIFDLAILGASVAAVAGFLVASARARRAAQGVGDVTTSDNRFSLLLESIEERRDVSPDIIRQLEPRDWRRVPA